MPTADGTDYFLFNAIRSKDDLDTRLRKSGVTGRVGNELSEVWVKGALPSFPEDATTLFRSITLEHPEHCEFAESNLENCLFSGTSVKEIEFFEHQVGPPSNAPKRLSIRRTRRTNHAD